jgi:hypothetical protein
VLLGHVEPDFPYISDAATHSPESCVFGQLMNGGTVLCELTLLIFSCTWKANGGLVWLFNISLPLLCAPTPVPLCLAHIHTGEVWISNHMLKAWQCGGKLRVTLCDMYEENCLKFVCTKPMSFWFLRRQNTCIWIILEHECTNFHDIAYVKELLRAADQILWPWDLQYLHKFSVTGSVPHQAGSSWFWASDSVCRF